MNCTIALSLFHLLFFIFLLLYFISFFLPKCALLQSGDVNLKKKKETRSTVTVMKACISSQVFAVSDLLINLWKMLLRHEYLEWLL